MANPFTQTLKIPKGVNNIRKKISNVVSQNTVDDFKAKIGGRGGLAKPDRFLVFISLPTGSLLSRLVNTDLQGLASTALSGNLSLSSFINDPRDMSLLCESCQFPGRVLNYIDNPDNMYGPTSKIVNGYSNEDCTMTFHVTNDFYVLKFFQKWQDKILNQKSNQIVNYPDTYSTNITIQAINDQNIPTYSVKLIKAYPQNIQAISFDNNSTDQTIKLSVTFAMKDFEREGAISSTISGVKSLFGK